MKGKNFECHEVAKVMSTENYEVFKILEGNRDVLKARVEGLRKSFQKEVIRNPITVNEKFEIIDGQGRFTVLKEMGLPIEYITIPGAGIEQCKIMNMAQRNWTQNDYINLYASIGDENYIRLKEVIDKTGYRVDQILRTVHKRGSVSENDVTRSPVTNGKLEYSQEEMETSLRKIGMIEEISEILLVPKRSQTYVYAIIAMIDFEGYDHKRMIQNCRANRNSFMQANDIRGNLIEFTRLYNYNRKKDMLNFTDYLANKGKSVRTY